MIGAVVANSQPASAEPTTIDHVTIVNVEDGTRFADHSITFDGDRITSVGPTLARRAGRHIDGKGLFVIPGLWDMHVHSHRERRWTYHYPLFRAFGITGVRDAGSHLGSALALREKAKTDPLAPRVIWGTPVVDGAPQVNSFGLSAEDATSGRYLVRELHRQGFDFLKVYDRLSPGAYVGLTSEARRLGMPVEGHVPLALSPDDAIAAGQRLIDHLTLIAEGCSPRSLSVVQRKNAEDPRESDSLSILMSNEVSSEMADFDVRSCRSLLERLARAHVWQVPTLVQLESFVRSEPPAVWPARRDYVSPGVQADWETQAKEAEPEALANGRRMFDIQMSLLKPMADAGVPILAGTDTSNEIWVFAGYSLHRELELFVRAGLSPLQALQTATLNPRIYAGHNRGRPLLSIGERADIVLLANDPSANIDNLATIRGVVARGMYYDRASLDALLLDAKRHAKTAGK
ncbi:amidohydrolase family protein [Sphingomonas rhizophila]|nr:amidohydrolase family protein [Sphingomonas rhizophila]